MVDFVCAPAAQERACTEFHVRNMNCIIQFENGAYLYDNYFFSSNKIPVLNVLIRGTQDILGLVVIIKETRKRH